MTSFEALRKDYSKYLQQCLKNCDVSTFQKKCIEQCPSEKDRKPAVDQALRDTLLVILSNKLTNNPRMLEVYIKFCIELCRKDVATPSIPVTLLSDIFDSITLDKCEDLFTYVENNVSVWKEELFFGACKNNILRMCNDLLRRLSRTQQTVFCGRILLFLAKFFPFSERSGLNIVSEFNLENHTEFDDDEGESEQKEQKMEVDETTPTNGEEKDTTEENKIFIDHGLYKKFWGLQDFFRNPNQCYNKMQWKTFMTHTASVISTFSSFKLDDQKDCENGDTENGFKEEKSMEVQECHQQETHYFAKYLTSEKLLELQLDDTNFRRYILLQFLILFQYLKSTVKFKTDAHELKADQAEWVKTTTEQIYILLKETPPNGVQFCESVQNILKREEYWNAWKNEGCPPFKKPIPEAKETEEVRKPKRQKRKLGEIVRDAHAMGKFFLGSAELTKLWNLAPNNLESCKSKDRDFLPSLETYFEEAINQLDPAAQVEEQYRIVNDGNFGWRALRLLAKKSPHFFVHGNYPINKLPEYLEMMIKKIAKDRPQPIVEQTKIESPEPTEKENNIEAGDKEMEVDEAIKEEGNEVAEAKSKSDPKVGRDTIDKIAEAIKDDWEMLGEKLGYTQEEISFFGKKSEPCKDMLVIWSEEDPEASVENLKTILESLNLTAGLDVLNT